MIYKRCYCCGFTLPEPSAERALCPECNDCDTKIGSKYVIRSAHCPFVIKQRKKWSGSNE